MQIVCCMSIIQKGEWQIKSFSYSFFYFKFTKDITFIVEKKLESFSVNI